MTNNLFLSSQQAVKAQEDLLGGKAKNLAWLSRQGLPVPKWWVLTTVGFTEQLDALGMTQWVQTELSKLTLTGQAIDNQVIEAVANNIQTAIAEQPLTPEIKQLIRERGHSVIRCRRRRGRGIVCRANGFVLVSAG